MEFMGKYVKVINGNTVGHLSVSSFNCHSAGLYESWNQILTYLAVG